jgi:hypothetical protein
MDRVVDDMGITGSLSTSVASRPPVHMRARRSPNSFANRNYAIFSETCVSVRQINNPFYGY